LAAAIAVQLCTLRWQGYFLGDTRGLPAPVLETIARQLGLLSMSIDDYPQNEKTRWEHLERIRQHLRFQQCDNFQRQRLGKTTRKGCAMDHERGC
jgi:Domain of unknown function (DUF4158)